MCKGVVFPACFSIETFLCSFKGWCYAMTGIIYWRQATQNQLKKRLESIKSKSTMFSHKSLEPAEFLWMIQTYSTTNVDHNAATNGNPPSCGMESRHIWRHHSFTSFLHPELFNLVHDFCWFGFCLVVKACPQLRGEKWSDLDGLSYNPERYWNSNIRIDFFNPIFKTKKYW